MWRLRQRSAHEVLRLGRVAAERWQELPGGLSCVASQPLPQDPADRLAWLPSAIEALYGPGGGAARVTVVLESAWVPLMLVETGDAVWRRADVEALLRHRLALLHDEPTNPVLEWDVRADHRAGDPRALGYGLSRRLQEALADAARRAGCGWSALVPAYAWGWQRAQPQRHFSDKTGHWVWQEQDRMLLGSFESGHLVALNAAVMRCDTSESLLQDVRVQAVRNGFSAVDTPVVATTWEAVAELPANTRGVVWQGLGAPSPRMSVDKVAA